MNNLNHIAIIMDGNGRWAKERNLPRTMGHKKGVEKVREIAIYANKLGVKCLTLYAFSTENWKRPETEVNYLMSLPKVFFKSYLKEIMENNIVIRMVGDMERIPSEAREIFESAIEQTKNNTGMVLNFAMNYGGQNEIVKAALKFANDYKEGKKDSLDEESFKDYLYTAGLPDVDLMIRTSNEQRISNFLLYQLAYSEFIFTDTYWPDFSCEDLDKCIEEFNHRTRRFGGLNETKNN
ncbi:MAG: isoprenyl transferase [Erysipelotrichaceae bacterium]|nr:isoprenyl transferase [Erysipelotrichaceae bacterium]